MITVKFACSGCEAEAEGLTHLKQRGTVEDVAPDGWIAFDPYTGCCYCPTCWKGIEANE